MIDRNDEVERLDRSRLPEGLRPETLAVRTALAPSQHGENSEGLFLSTAFVQPDARTSARRFPDGAANWLFFAEPTPGAANTTQGFDAWLQPPLFSVPGAHDHQGWGHWGGANGGRHRPRLPVWGPLP